MGDKQQQQSQAQNPFLYNFEYQPQRAPPPTFETTYIPQLMPSNANTNNNGNGHKVNNNQSVNDVVKCEDFSNSVNLPTNMQKISSVSRVRSQHGYDAFDEHNNFIGCFDETATFFDAEQIGSSHQPSFDHNQMLMRSHSDDRLFYESIRSSIFDTNNK